MAIPDTSIWDWTTAANTNLPTDATLILNGDFARQIRNLKSVARGESLEKEFEATGYTTASTVGGTPSAIFFAAADGNLVSTFAAGRKVRLRPASGGSSYVYSSVLEAAFLSMTTQVALVDLAGVLPTGTDGYFVDVGVEDPGATSLPLHIQGGTATIANTNTNAVVTFAHAEPDPRYFVHVQSLEVALPANARRVESIARTNTGMTITLKAAPGAGNIATLGWVAMREVP